MNVQKLLECAREVMTFPGGEEERRASFPDFFENHNRLFNIICSGRCDLSLLEMMLTKVEEIESGTTTVSSASAVVAGRLNALYVDSVVPQPSSDQALRKGEETRVTVIEKH